MIKLNLPQQRTVFNSLTIGDKVLLSGTLYTARDKAHKLLAELIRNGEELPFPLQNSIIYYTGPVLEHNTGSFVSAGPTTSGRMDSYTEPLLANGVLGLIGKGTRSKAVQESIKQYKAVYFSTIGGAGVYLAARIKNSEIIAFPELLAEAVYRIEVEDFPCYVAIDSSGKSIYEEISKK